MTDVTRKLTAIVSADVVGHLLQWSTLEGRGRVFLFDRQAVRRAALGQENYKKMPDLKSPA